MSPRRNQDPYVLYKLGGLTVTVTDNSCDSCGRLNMCLLYSSKRRNSGAVSVCQVCMKDISTYHREYIESRRSGGQ